MKAIVRVIECAPIEAGPQRLACPSRAAWQLCIARIGMAHKRKFIFCRQGAGQARKGLGMRRQRNAKRRSAGFASYIRCGAFQRVAIVIDDISFGGVSATSDAELSSGMPISVEVPTIGLVRAKVMWTEGRRFGASFLKPVDVRKCFPDLLGE